MLAVSCLLTVNSLTLPPLLFRMVETLNLCVLVLWIIPDIERLDIAECSEVR